MRVSGEPDDADGPTTAAGPAAHAAHGQHHRRHRLHPRADGQRVASVGDQSGVDVECPRRRGRHLRSPGASARAPRRRAMESAQHHLGHVPGARRPQQRVRGDGRGPRQRHALAERRQVRGAVRPTARPPPRVWARGQQRRHRDDLLQRFGQVRHRLPLRVRRPARYRQRPGALHVCLQRPARTERRRRPAASARPDLLLYRRAVAGPTCRLHRVQRRHHGPLQRDAGQGGRPERTLLMAASGQRLSPSPGR